jgi:hypothetical protein
VGVEQIEELALAGHQAAEHGLSFFLSKSPANPNRRLLYITP